MSVSCVIYQADLDMIKKTIESLVASCIQAKSNNVLDELILVIVDNGPDDFNKNTCEIIGSLYQFQVDKLIFHTDHGNIGYGAGHNKAIFVTESHYHLVLNPDVIVSLDNISIAIDYMNQHADVGILAPDAFNPDGSRQYIAKRQPTWYVLAARAINISWLNHALKASMDNYEYRDLIPASQPIEIELASGCYMFMRSESVKKIGGFDKDFFMYFEDFDLSRRIQNICRIMHCPQLHIVHYGGGVSAKGRGHIRFFFASYFKFLFKN